MVEQRIAVILNRDRNAVGLGGGDVGLHPFEEALHRGLEFGER